MRSKLYIGPDPDIEIPKKGGCLLIDNKVQDIPEWRHPRIFDPLLDNSFNPLADLDYLKKCTIVDIFDALFPRGDTTLTKEMGLEYIADTLDREPKSFRELADLIPLPDKKSLPGHIWAYSKVRRILRSPVLKAVFCNKPNFAFKRGSVNQVRIDWAELGTFDALALGLFAINEFDGPIIIPSFHKYARPFHTSLIERDRLIAGVPTLSQLKGELHDMALLMEMEGRRCTYKDAQSLAERAGLRPDPTREDNPYNRFIDDAMAA
jgi:hypothetical protein